MRIATALSFLALIVFGTISCDTSAEYDRKSEAELIANLSSPDPLVVRRSLQHLELQDANSTNAIPAIKKLLVDPNSMVRRKAARVLGQMHAPMDDADIKHVCALLTASDPNEVIDGLKTLRALKAERTVPEILPLLHHKEPAVQRNTCLTLGVLGDKSIIPAIEPLLQNPDPDVKSGARLAIDMLRAKDIPKG